jgi:hypothetical protein
MFWMMMYLLLFGGGLSVDPSLFPPEDALRKAVADPQRQELVLAAQRDVERAREALRADAIREYDALRKLSRDRASAEADWDAVFGRMDRDWSQAESATLDALYQMRAAMTPEEWQAVFAPPWYRRLLP